MYKFYNDYRKISYMYDYQSVSSSLMLLNILDMS